LTRSLLLSPSYPLAAAIVGAHLCAAVAVVVSFAGWSGGAIGAALAGLGAASAWSRALLRARRSVQRIELSAGRAMVSLTSGARLAAQPAGHVSRHAVTLRLPASRRTILVTADMLDRESFRVLRMWALWGKLPGVAGKQLAA
jgi:hypothetical protein